MYRVLFVCTANICRSPIAQGLMEKKLAASGSGEAWEISSAGTWAAEGRPASPTVQKLMEERGVDLSEHRSREVDGDMLADHDLVLVMEPGHKEALEVEFPDQADKVFMLSELKGKEVKVRDPNGDPEEVYKKVIEKIEGYLEEAPGSLLDLLKKR